ncbi:MULTISPECIES: glycosyltransferase family 2 protein [Planktothricoides]|uniref:Glycosyltransferase family 2 protein n=2 Tax=Planktothricoides raciborskii TaxID=132608 RepID=A0AAU8JFI7_9CYAN|nr:MULTISPECIES: glycosyltransferase family 2 protein [Planktothricoides]MBD2544121.1 glycosyltransferase family 2 protein [Planktothricoides raciborskii FACHB-1370]MBD2582606.1 glycosyltransferase family 2 protein [Planktothricoides raciborskii FACHB-1261]
MLKSLPYPVTNPSIKPPSQSPLIQSYKTNWWRDPQKQKPLVSLIVPGYNEAAIVEQNLTILCEYMESLQDTYDWEIVVINDGSLDETGELAEAFASTRENVYVLHHITNFGLGQALKFGFNYCHGDYVVVIDLDLSYAPEHIERLLSKMRETLAKIVVASPYIEGGNISNVPWARKKLSIWANRFLSATSKGELATVTGMVRAYDGQFLRSLNLRSMSMDINPEIIYKARILRARIEEIPAHLNWRVERTVKKPKRRSSMRIWRQIWSVLFSGFISRPVIFFLIPGLFLFGFSCLANAWVLIHTFTNYQNLPADWFLDRFSDAVAGAFHQAPHTFIIGGMTLMLAIQLVSLGIISMQTKSNFEEMFYLGTAIYKLNKQNKQELNKKH